MKIKKLSRKDFFGIYSKVPRLCVDLIIKSKDGILLTKRDIPPEKGWWHFPGGTVLYNEKLEHAGQRVAEEELNTKVEIHKLLGLLEYPKSGTGYPIAAEFLVKPVGNLKGGAQAKEIGFYKTPPRKTLPEVRQFLKTLLKNR